MKTNFKKLSQEERLIECRKPFAPKTRPHKNKKTYKRIKKTENE